MRKKISKEQLEKLYQKEGGDYVVTPYEDGSKVALSIFRNYKDEVNRDFLILIVVAILNDGTVLGKVNKVVKPQGKNSNLFYLAEDKKFLNFNLEKNDDIKFGFKKMKITYKNKYLNINEFVDNLEQNHFKGGKNIYEKFKVILFLLFLKFIYKLADIKYNPKYTFIPRENPLEIKLKKAFKPPTFKTYFRDFKIYRNLFITSIFSLILLIIISTRFNFIGNFTINIFFSNSSPKLDNPLSLLYFIFMLLMLEKISIWLEINFKEKGIFYTLSNKHRKMQTQFKLKM